MPVEMAMLGYYHRLLPKLILFRYPITEMVMGNSSSRAWKAWNLQRFCGIAMLMMIVMRDMW